MARHLRRQGHGVNRKRIKRLMQKMGIEAVYQKPRTSDPNPAHKIFPHLLRGMTIDRPNQAWCTDITYIPMRQGFLYLVAIMDWYSRKVLAWRSLKYECVYLQGFENGTETREGIGGWIRYYNSERPHSSLDGGTPDEVYS